MKVAVITDIHGNRHALLAVLSDLRLLGTDEVVFGGDIALFGAQPRECWERIVDLRWLTVQGNTDRYITDRPTKIFSGNNQPSGSEFLKANVEWTTEQLGASHVARMRTMRRQVRIESDAGLLLIVHGTPANDELGWDRSDSETTILEKIGDTDAAVVVSGHTHTAAIRHTEDLLAVNCGAVGRSHDQQPGLATYAVLDDNCGFWSAELRRVAYDYQSAHAEVLTRNVPVPPIFADTLLTGRPPA